MKDGGRPARRLRALAGAFPAMSRRPGAVAIAACAEPSPAVSGRGFPLAVVDIHDFTDNKPHG